MPKLIADALVEEIRFIANIEDRAEQIDRLVAFTRDVLKYSIINDVEDLLYAGEEYHKVDMAARVADYLNIVCGSFEQWWELVSPKVDKACDLNPLEEKLVRTRQKREQLENKRAEVIEKQKGIKDQLDAVRKKEEELRLAEAELLEKEEELLNANKSFEALTKSIKELKTIRDRLAPDVVRNAFELVLNAGRNSLLAFEESIQAIGRQAEAYRDAFERILNDDRSIVSAMQSCEEQANKLSGVAKLMDNVLFTFQCYVEAAEELERWIRDYIRERDGFTKQAPAG